MLILDSLKPLKMITDIFLQEQEVQTISLTNQSMELYTIFQVVYQIIPHSNREIFVAKTPATRQQTKKHSCKYILWYMFVLLLSPSRRSE